MDSFKPPGACDRRCRVGASAVPRSDRRAREEPQGEGALTDPRNSISFITAVMLHNDVETPQRMTGVGAQLVRDLDGSDRPIPVVSEGQLTAGPVFLPIRPQARCSAPCARRRANGEHGGRRQHGRRHGPEPTFQVSDDARNDAQHEGADAIPDVAPEAIDADGRSAPRGLGDVGDGSAEIARGGGLAIDGVERPRLNRPCACASCACSRRGRGRHRRHRHRRRGHGDAVLGPMFP